MTKIFDYQFRKKIELYIYPSLESFKNSNVGVKNYSTNEGGKNSIKFPRFKVYFNGSHADLKHQIREGIASILLGKILSGTSLQEIVQNSVLMNLPPWFVKGAIQYNVTGWNADFDDRLRDILLSRKYANFLEFANKEPLLAGLSLFYFIEKEYSKATISNLIYLTRINRSVENGFLYVFGKTFYQVVGTDWVNFYADRYNKDNNKRRFPGGGLKLEISTKKNIDQVQLNASANKLAYVSQWNGSNTIVVEDLENGRRQQVYKKNTFQLELSNSEDRPKIRWSSDPNELIIIENKLNGLAVIYLDVSTGKRKKTQNIPELDGVSDFIVKGSKIYLCAFRNGQSDIFELIGNRLRRLTNDSWDEYELEIAKIKGRVGLIFSSNRIDDIAGQFDPRVYKYSYLASDLFFLNLEDKNAKQERLTYTPFIKEREVLSVEEDIFIYLSDKNGFDNRYVASMDTVLVDKKRVLILEDSSRVVLHLDSFYSHLNVDSQFIQPVYTEMAIDKANTDYSRNIQSHSVVKDKVLDVLIRNDRYMIFLRTLQLDRDMQSILPTNFRKELDTKLRIKSDPFLTALNIEQQSEAEPGDSTYQNFQEQVPEMDTGLIDIENYQFQTDFEEVKKKENNDSSIPKVLIEEEDGSISLQKQEIKKSIPNRKDIYEEGWEEDRNKKYKNIFRVDHITTQFDNTPLFNGMDLYLGSYYNFQPISFAVKSAFVDLFDDYNLELGFRLPMDFNGFEFYVSAKFKKGLIDQRYSYYRRSRIFDYVLYDSTSTTTYEMQGRTIKNLIQSEHILPINRFHSAKLISTLQLDNIAFLATDYISLQVPNYTENRFGLRMEYVFDNTQEIRLNALKGFRFKGYFECYKPFNLSINEGFKLDLSGGLTTALGFDARYYYSFDNKTVLAGRLAGAGSFGQEKILYSLGGLESALFTAYNNTIPLPSSSEYGLQTVAANLRGFNSNSRNGSSYVLGNLELRVPIIEYITRTIPKNALWRTFQLVAFLDIGTAWQGTSPFSADNPLNSTVVSNNTPGVVTPVKVTVNYFRRPILFGYGFGIRTVLLGHYFRLDYAWGVETGQVQNPILYLSIGTDF